jgi:translation initiation factor 2 alpha subunit (eIF-2alpha)
MTELQPGDIVMCIVDRIVGTTVFVQIDGNGEGSIILSEIAPGRIRNLRDYVVPKKNIICKVLRASNDHVDLSLRRVTPKEQKEIKERYNLEKSYKSILKTILSDEAENIIKEILEQSNIYEFLESAKENPIHLEKIVGKEKTSKILEILKSQKQRKVLVKKEFALFSFQPNGIELIKKIIGDIKEADIRYLSAGNYSIKIEASDPKKADTTIRDILLSTEKKARKEGLDFSIKEK